MFVFPSIEPKLDYVNSCRVFLSLVTKKLFVIYRCYFNYEFLYHYYQSSKLKTLTRLLIPEI
jgi:hypothetical protein